MGRSNTVGHSHRDHGRNRERGTKHVSIRERKLEERRGWKSSSTLPRSILLWWSKWWWLAFHFLTHSLTANVGTYFFFFSSSYRHLWSLTVSSSTSPTHHLTLISLVSLIWLGFQLYNPLLWCLPVFRLPGFIFSF